MNSLLAIASVLAALAGIAAAAAVFLRPAPSGSPSVPRRILISATVILFCVSLVTVVIAILSLNQIGPFETRNISITSGAGNTGCVTDLAGAAKLPAGEDAWIILQDADSGASWLQGPNGQHPVLVGEAHESWSLPGVVVTDKYPGSPAGHTVLGIIVPFSESVRLLALPHGAPLAPGDFPQDILASTRAHIDVVSSKGC